MQRSRSLSSVCLGSAMLMAMAARAETGSVYKVVVDGVIHSVSADHILETLRQAEEAEAALVLVQLKTPGGVYTSTREIVEAILASKVPVVVYVAPPGAHAASAGFLITLASDIAAMAPGTTTGAATPVLGGGQEMGETMKMKAQSDAAAFARSLAAQRRRPVELAELAVTEARSWTANEALAEGLVEIVARDEAELLTKLDGYPLTRSDGSEVRLETASPRIVLVEMTRRQRFLSFLADPQIAVLLGLIGLAGLYVEFSNPGLLIPGILGGIALLLAAFALQILPVNVVGLILMVAGVGLLIAEAFTPSFGALGLGGIAGIVIGGLVLFEDPILPTPPEMRVPWSFLLPVALVLAAIVLFFGRLVLDAQRRPSTMGSQAMIGQFGTARTAIAGEGKVFLRGEFWDARSSDEIKEGERIKVTSIDGLTLGVERAPDLETNT